MQKKQVKVKRDEGDTLFQHQGPLWRKLNAMINDPSMYY